MDLYPGDRFILDGGPWEGVVCDPPFENGFPQAKCAVNWKGESTQNLELERVQSIGSYKYSKPWRERIKVISGRPIVEDTRSYLEAITNEKLGGS